LRLARRKVARKESWAELAGVRTRSVAEGDGVFVPFEKGNTQGREKKGRAGGRGIWGRSNRGGIEDGKGNENGQGLFHPRPVITKLFKFFPDSPLSCFRPVI